MLSIDASRTFQFSQGAACILRENTIWRESSEKSKTS